MNAYLAERKQLAEEHLFASLPAEGTRPAILAEAMRHAVLSGGKRLRPILCLAAADALLRRPYRGEWQYPSISG